VLVVPRRGTDAGHYGVAFFAAGSEAERKHLMARKPQPLLSWDIYRAAVKAKCLGTVEATDADAAIAEAAKEFKMDASKLIAVQHP
jgi:hypothetical protein